MTIPPSLSKNTPSSRPQNSGFEWADSGSSLYSPTELAQRFRFTLSTMIESSEARRQAGRFLNRFWTILGFFLKVLFYSWWDAQVWTYIGAEDIDRAQLLRRRRHAKWVTQKLLDLGPTFIKVGQSISTRVDLIRKEYIEELSKLQDRVPPFSIDEVRRIVTEELGAPPEEVFVSFDPTPLAAASLGQVHRATIPVTSLDPREGSEPRFQEVAIKVQRPHLAETFWLDLAVMRRIAYFLQMNTELGRGREWVQIVDEFGKTLFEEIDYIQEGRHADRFRSNFKNQSQVVIPEVFWRYTSRRVIALEYCPGIKINDLHAIELKELDRKYLAETCVKAYFQQILMDGFYHADPHPGNIAVRDDGVIIFYDFGMVGQIQEKTRLVMVDTFMNMVQKKPDHILNNLLELDMVGPSADLEVIRQLIAWSLDHYYDVPHEELNFEQLTDELSELMYAHPFKLPASFTFLIRALITLEGLSATLYPSIRFLSIAVDYAQNFVGRSLNLDFLLRKGRDLLGLPPGGEHSGFGGRRTIPRVRLQYDEWTPLARYVKAGFLLLGLGQSLILLFLLLLTKRILPFSGFIEGVLIAGVVGFSLLVMSTVLLMPSRKKPIRFEPRTHRLQQGD